ncbi:MAG: N-acetyltransferase family protein [Chloroflexi bacterium]|nr:MAG: N-acetyltransferase family protein [Chloroflexota bacterium]
MGITVRDATKADVPTILDIYNYEVLHGTATFDIEPKTLADRLIWFRETQRPPHRVIVVDDGAGVAGWGCLHPFHTRAAYRFTTEDSVYIHQNRRGEGIGKLILARLIEVARLGGFHSIMAGTSEGNEASVRLHQRFGFEVVGVQREVGYKFEHWIDVTWMQKMLE